jgi:hypothetical protein
MGRKVKIPEIDLLDLVGTENREFPLKEIADYFDTTKKTAQKACSRARKNGHPIIPTNKGEYYIIRITTPEQFNAVAAAIGWSSRMQHEARRIGKIAGDVQSTATPRIERKAEQLRADDEAV